MKNSREKTAPRFFVRIDNKEQKKKIEKELSPTGAALELSTANHILQSLTEKIKKGERIKFL